MDEQQNPRPDHTDDDDVEGHGFKTWGADAETAETAETDDDTEGHRRARHADQETAETDDDVEGHDSKWKRAAR